MYGTGDACRLVMFLINHRIYFIYIYILFFINSELIHNYFINIASPAKS